MKCKFVGLLMAEGVAFDQITSRLTAFNVLDFIFAANAPAMLTRMAVVATYELAAEPDVFEERVSLRGPDGAVVAHTQSRIETRAHEVGVAPSSHNSLHTFWNTLLVALGDYSVVLEVRANEAEEWSRLAARRLTVMRLSHPLFPRQSAPSAETDGNDAEAPTPEAVGQR